MSLRETGKKASKSLADMVKDAGEIGTNAIEAARINTGGIEVAQIPMVTPSP